MKLRDYLAQRALSETEFARLLGVGQATVNRYVSEKRIPRPPIMRKIGQITEGKVTASDFYHEEAAA